MKKYVLTIVVLVLFSVTSLFSQTSLIAGDIAFIGVNSDGDDDFSMVLLKDISAGTSFFITDKGWNDGLGFRSEAADGTWLWSTTTALSAGDIIHIKTSNNGSTVPDAFASTPGTMSWVHTGAIISYAGDQVFIYQGTHASPTFIAGVHWNVEPNLTSETTDIYNWDQSSTSVKTSALPNQLTNGVNAIWLYQSGPKERDNFKYNCSTTSGTPNALRTAINNISNWDVDVTGSNGDTPYTINPFPCSFTINSATDITKPEITCAPTPSPIVAGSNGKAAIPDLVTATTATDDVSAPANIIIVQNPVAGSMVTTGEHEVVLTATDQAGNNASCSIYVTVNEPPSTILSAGDIAFIGINSDGNDDFAFVLLKDIIEGTKLNITDHGWSDGASSFRNESGDGVLVWYATSNMSAGTIVHFQTSNNGAVQAPVSTPQGSITGNTGVSQLGDQLFIYQGTSLSPTFITGIHWNVESTSNSLNWDDGATVELYATTSDLPDQLTNGTNAIWLYAPGPFERDNFRYKCSELTTGTPSALRSSINNISNWDIDLTGTNGDTPYTINPYPCSITIPANIKPTASSFTATPTRYVPHIFATANFSYSDGDGDPIDHVRITAIPAHGTLYIDANDNDFYDGGEAVSNGNTVSKANLDAGNFQYYNTNGTSTSFTFDVNDGTDYSASTYTTTLTVGAASNPTITFSTYNGTTGVLVVTGTNIYANSSGSDIDVSTLTFTGEGSTTYTLTNSTDVERTSITQFTVTLSAADKAAVGQILNNNGTASSGATTYNLGADEDWVTVVDASENIADATNSINVSNVPVSTVISSTYNATTGVLVVTGTSLVKKAGASDVDVSKITLTGEGANTYTLVSSSDVEITSSTNFTVTLSGSDRFNLNSILNKDGTSSGDVTTYNMACAEDWMTGTDLAVNNVDLTGNGVTVSAVVSPAVTSATYDANTGILVVTGTNMTQKVGATNDIDVTKLTLRGEAAATYTLTSTNVEITSATEFSVTLNATDKLNVNGLCNKDGTVSGDNTTYNLSAVDNWATAANATANIADVTNGITVSNISTPAITSATYDFSTGVMVVTGTNFIKKVGVINDISIPKLTITGGNGDTYTLTTSNVEVSSATAFTVTLNATDKVQIGGLLNKDGTSSGTGTTYNLAAADNWVAGANSAVDISDLSSNGITTSNVTAPAITSATYDFTTGILVVAGTNFVKKSGASNDIDVSTFTLTGEGGDTYVLTTSDVEISSGTSFTVILNASDKLDVDGLLNKNGTSSGSGTTYNLSAAEDWATGADPATNVADLTGNGITVSNTTIPTITSAMYDYNTGVLVATGTNFRKKSGVTNDVDISLFTFKGEAASTYTLTSSTDVEITSSTEFSLTISGEDKLHVDGLLNKDGVSSSDNTTFNLSAADNWMTGAAAASDISDANSGITVSNFTLPTITSATYDASTGVIVVTGTSFVHQPGGTNDIAVSLLTVTGEASGTHTLTSSNVEITSATQFSITMNATDKLNINSLCDKDGTSSSGSTTYNVAGADNWCTGSPASANIADLTSNGITVSNVVVPAITSATYDYTTGVLVVIGTNFVKEAGASNDIDISLLTVTGEGGTYTLTTSDVEVTSATSFSVSINASDKITLNGLMNKDGTSSSGGTTYNLAVADNWAVGANPSTDISDLTGNGITVSNVATPAITSATLNATTGALVVTGTNFTKKTGAANDIDVSLFTLKGEAATTYTLTSATDIEISSATSFTVTVAGADLLGITEIINKNGTASLDNTTYNLAAADNWATAVAPATNCADATNGVTVSNMVLPTITSAHYNSVNGVCVVTGTTIRALVGANNDIDASTFTFTGEGGATYTLTNSSDVERDSQTQFTIILSSTDKIAINVLLNKGGTSSNDATTYNLAAGEDWNSAVDPASNIADVTGNSITVLITPVANCKDIPVYLDATGSVSIGSSVINDGSTYDSGLKTMTLDKSDFSCADVGENTVTLTITDLNENTDFCTATVTVIDNIAPTANCKHKTLSLNANGEVAVSVRHINNGSWDACGIQSMSVKPNSFSETDIGVNSVVLTVTDNNGNVSTCKGTVTVVDNTPPIVFCNTADYVITSNGQYELTQVDINALANGTYDNVSAYEDLVISISPMVLICSDIGGAILHVYASDEAGNIDSCAVHVGVSAGSTALGLDAIADVTTDEDNPLSVSFSGITGSNACNAPSIAVRASNDNSSLINSLTVNYTSSDTSGTLNIDLVPNESGMATITVVLEDSTSGEKVSKSFLLTVNPVNDPPFVVQELSNQEVKVNETLEIEISKVFGVLFDDVDDTVLTYNVRFENEDLPDWVTTTDEVNSLLLNFEPLLGDTGCYNILVDAEDVAGAVASDTFKICVEQILVGIGDLEINTMEVQLYPNPSKGMVNLGFSRMFEGEAELRVMNIAGQTVLQKTYRSAEQIEFSLSENVSGLYMVVLQVEGERVVKKLILDKD